MADRTRSVGKNFTRALKSTTSLQEDCLVLKTDADGIVDLCDNATQPYAIAYRSTQDKFQASVGKTAYLTGADLTGQIAMFRSGWAELPLDFNHAAINIGDPITVGAGDIGRVDKLTIAAYTDLLLIVGWSEEKVAAGGVGTRIKPTLEVALDIRGGAP